MKKIILVIILSLPFMAEAQWLASGSNIYNTNTGNVGIGTGSSSFKLNIDPQGAGEVLVGNPNTAGVSYTSLLLCISAIQNGYYYVQRIKASGSDFGTLVFNPCGGTVAIGTNSSGGYSLRLMARYMPSR